MEEKIKSFDLLQHKNDLLGLENQKLKLEKEIQKIEDSKGKTATYRDIIALIESILKDVRHYVEPYSPLGVSVSVV